MDKAAVHTHTRSYYSAMKKNEIRPFLEMWMDLENVIQSEIRERKSNMVY